MPRAFVRLRETPHYRRDAFVEGLTRLGYHVICEDPTDAMRPDDVALVWNDTSRGRLASDAARKAGAAVLVAENGYWGKDHNGIHAYALALDGHNGSGRWFCPDDDSRLDQLHIEFSPFRPAAGTKVVVAEQRGIGSPLMASPPRWAETTADRLHVMGFQPHIRRHPGTKAPATTLAEDLIDAGALVVWSSNCATYAQVVGVPTYFAAPTIATAPGPRRFPSEIAVLPDEGERLTGFRRMSWAQAFIDEIAHGDVLKNLMDVHTGKLPATSGLA